MQDFSYIATDFPIGCSVVADNGNTYKVIGHLVKSGKIAGTTITISREVGVKYLYAASKLTRVEAN